MKKTVTPRTFIVFSRTNVLEILRYTNLNLIEVGSLWITAMASQSDIETFKLNGWNYWK